jgi:hypothetical protein
MDSPREYYDWIHGLVDSLVSALEKETGHKFICDQEMMEEAAKHSEAMMNCGQCYPAPENFLWPAVSEMVDLRIACYKDCSEKDFAIRCEITKMAVDFLEQHYHSYLRCLSAVLGAGIAIKESPGQVKIFATIRLTTAKLRGINVCP